MVGIKCMGHPTLVMTEGLQVKKVKLSDGGTCRCVHSADFNKLYSTMVHLAVGHYQSILANSTIYLILIMMKTHTNCNLKNMLYPLVETKFGFSNEKTPEVIKSNALLTATLIRNHKLLTCKNHEGGKGLFEVDTILKGMIKWCYNRKNSMGVILASYFKDPTTGRASLGIMAAVLTGIEACVTEWMAGMRIETCFYKEHYAAVFKSYHKMLIDFDEGMKHTDILPKICKRLLRHAQYMGQQALYLHHVNVPEDLIGVGGTLDNFLTDKFAVAVAEWDGRVESDDEY
ncbi:hypothetical protein F4604DRAFT_1681534 [Suillus subluteus]|nr:hypothetical protein F4604DRAFT_1681534 [Suillus subluteus]